MKTAPVPGAYAYHALVNTLPGMPQVCFEPETGAGSGAADDTVAAEAEAAATAAAEAEAAEAAAAAELAAAEEAAAAAEDEGKDTKALAAEKAKLLREVMDKKNKLKDAEKKAADAATALAAYEGVDPAKVKELLKKEADAERAAAEAAGDFERVKEMMAAEHAKETKSLQDRIAALESEQGSFKDTIANLTVGNDFASSTFIKDKLTLTPAKARIVYGSHFEIVDGKTVGFNKPAGAAGRTELIGSDGKPLPFDEAFKRIIEQDPDKETLLKAKVNPGSGSTSTQVETKEKTATGGFGVDRIRASFGG